MRVRTGRSVITHSLAWQICRQQRQGQSKVRSAEMEMTIAMALKTLIG